MEKGNGLYFCRYWGEELEVGEVDICDECYEKEQARL